MFASLKLLDLIVSLPKESGTQVTRPDLRIIEETLTRQGFEVESVREPGKGLEQVVVGRIEDARPHPQADRLRVCRVDVGASAPRQIVCGAPNAQTGLMVAVALPGAKLPNGLDIAETTIRGVDSRGMLCGRDELGMEAGPGAEGEKGIWELSHPDEGVIPESELTPLIGKPLFPSLGLDDIVLDISVTPNRPDALCHLGIARELYAGFAYQGLDVQWYGLSFLSQKLQKSGFETTSLRLQEKAKELLEDLKQGRTSLSLNTASDTLSFSAANELSLPCFFMGVEGVKPTRSPSWLRGILESLGQNSVNSIVDLSNFLLLLIGQPSHAFDVEKLSADSSQALTLRFASEGEAFLGLDGKERKLGSEDCVVSDARQPQALLGVLGGELSKVDASSQAIVIEIANPDPVSVRRSSRRHGKKTDSSFQFEKGIDRVARVEAAALLVELVLALHPDARSVGALASQVEVPKTKVTDGNRSGSSEQAPEHPFGTAQESFFSVGESLLAFDPESLLIESSNRLSDSLQSRKCTHLWFPNSLKEYAGYDLASWEEQLSILSWLGFSFASSDLSKALSLEEAKFRNGEKADESGKGVAVHPPHWRWLDISGQADLAEEIVRVVGMDQVPSTPIEGVLDARSDDTHFELLEHVAQAATHLGYTEVTSFHFMRQDDLVRLGLSSSLSLGTPISLLNPIIQDEPMMHTTLIPDLLRKVRRNINYGVKRGQLFHSARTYQDLDPGGNHVFKEGEADLSEGLMSSAYSPSSGLVYSRDEGVGHRPVETPRLAAVAFGQREEKNWFLNEAREWRLHDLMAHIRDVCGQVGVEVAFTRMPESDPFSQALHPGQRVSVWGEGVGGTKVSLGWVAQLHPRALRNFEIEDVVFAFELNVANLIPLQLRHLAFEKGQYKVHKLPLVHRDFAFVLDERAESGAVKAEVEKAFDRVMSGVQKQSKLSQFRVFDIYRGDNVPAGKKSLAFQICIEPLEETLSEQLIQQIGNEIVQSLEVHLGAELRK